MMAFGVDLTAYILCINTKTSFPVLNLVIFAFAKGIYLDGQNVMAVHYYIGIDGHEVGMRASCSIRMRYSA